MRLIADRYVADERGRTIDLATGETVSMISSPSGGSTEQVSWAERCAWLTRAAHPALAPLVDYGLLGEALRFEAWGAAPGWRGSPGAASQARTAASQFLIGHNRAGLPSDGVLIGARSGRAVVVPDAHAGCRVSNDAPEGTPAIVEQPGGRACLGVVREPDRQVEALAEMLGSAETDRLPAVGVWMSGADDPRSVVLALARAARVAGRVPVLAPLVTLYGRTLLRERTLVVFSLGDPEEGWRASIDASLDTPRPHTVVFVGPHTVRRVHMVSPQRASDTALIASVGPPVLARQYLRSIAAAARRASGVRERFERLLFGDGTGAGRAPMPAPTPRLTATRRMVAPLGTSGPSHLARDVIANPLAPRVAETLAAYAPKCEDAPAVQRPFPVPTWPMPGELARLRRQLASGCALLTNGRQGPGERSVRQCAHAFARRGEWSYATEAAMSLVRSILRRGRLRDAAQVLADARGWATESRDTRMLAQFGLLHARVQLESGHLADAELLIDTVLAAAVSTHRDLEITATLALVRCLYWQGRFTEAWRRLMLLPPDADLTVENRIRTCLARSRVAIGRERVADAVANAARARDEAAALGQEALLASAHCACAVAQLRAGDAVQAAHVTQEALRVARRAHDPLLTLRIRVLHAEAARRQGQTGVAARLLARLPQAMTAPLPLTTRARVELLRSLVSAGDGSGVAERLADAVGLPALRLYAPARPSGGPGVSIAADDMVALLQSCQGADEDGAVLKNVCVRVRAALRANGVAFFVLEHGELVQVAGDGARVDVAAAQRVLRANAFVAPHNGGERAEGGMPVRYAGVVTGALVAAWAPSAWWHESDAALLLGTGATAAAPALAGLVATRARSSRSRTSELLGVSASIATVRAAVERAAAAPFAVLVEGESGSGKELVARLLHTLGARRDRPFCTVNCAALPDELVESELFGHARGAFTGAVAERRGVFEEASTGTLFLDEIGELSARAQAKVLRVIQEGEIRRVGENVCRRVDVRLVTATNRDLRVEAAAGRFRLDLLYRLDVIRIPIPPLRERRDDIPVLAEHFWREAAGRVGSRATLSPSTLAALSRYDWPGNIRELQNVLAALVVRCSRRGVVPPSALPSCFGADAAAPSMRLDSARRTFDRSFVRAALVRSGGHRSRAAEELGVSRQGLAKLMTRLEIEDGTDLGEAG